MHRIRISAVIAMLVAAAAFAQTKQPLTHETLFLMKRVGAPLPSPDGKWVVFPVTEPSYDEKEVVSDLWIVPSDGSAKPHRITSSKAAESDVTWAPDSHRIAFSAKREGDDANQIYILDLNGGEAQRVTSLSTGTRSPLFRPDGKAILFSSSVYPGTSDDEANKKIAKERKDRKYNVRAFDSFPIKAWDRWLDDKQVHLFVQDLDSGSKPRDILGGTSLVKEVGFAGRTGEGSREDIDADWSSDGESIVFAATSKRNSAAYAEYPIDLYRISARGGEPQIVTHGEGEYSRPHFSPDGKTLFAVFNENNGKVYNLGRIVRLDWPSLSNRKTVNDAPFDRSTGSYVITSDNKMIYFTAEDSGLEKIYAVPAGGGETKLAIEPQRGVYTRLAAAAKGRSVVAIVADSANGDSAFADAVVANVKSAFLLPDMAGTAPTEDRVAAIAGAGGVLAASSVVRDVARSFEVPSASLHEFASRASSDFDALFANRETIDEKDARLDDDFDAIARLAGSPGPGVLAWSELAALRAALDARGRRLTAERIAMADAMSVKLDLKPGATISYLQAPPFP